MHWRQHPYVAWMWLDKKEGRALKKAGNNCLLGHHLFSFIYVISAAAVRRGARDEEKMTWEALKWARNQKKNWAILFKTDVSPLSRLPTSTMEDTTAVDGWGGGGSEADPDVQIVLLLEDDEADADVEVGVGRPGTSLQNNVHSDFLRMILSCYHGNFGR